MIVRGYTGWSGPLLSAYSQKQVYAWHSQIVRLTSSTAEPTEQAMGLPPNVLKWRAFPIVSAISGVVATAASGKPLPIPFAITTVRNKHLIIIDVQCRKRVPKPYTENWAVPSKNMSSCICGQWGPRSDCTYAQSDLGPHCPRKITEHYRKMCGWDSVHAQDALRKPAYSNI